MRNLKDNCLINIFYNWSKKRMVLIFVLVSIYIPIVSFSQSSDLDNMSLDEISRKLENPLTDLWSLTLQENFSVVKNNGVDGNYYSNNLFFQPFMPVPIGEKYILSLRPVFPFVSNSFTINHVDGNISDKNSSGFGDIQLAALFGPSVSTGLLWGVGISSSFPTASNEYVGSGKWQIGPSVVLLSLTRPWTLGVFLQHWKSFAGDAQRSEVNFTSLQYIIRYALPKAWSIGMGPNITYKWDAETGDRLTLPIGLGLTKTVRIGNAPYKIRFEPQYSLVKPDNWGTLWNVRFQITPVIKRPKFMKL